MKVKSIKWPMAEVLAEGLCREVNIQLVPKVKVGEYVLVHAGFAIQIIEQKSAMESLQLWEKMKF